MLRSGQGVEAGEFNIFLDKLDSTLTKAKGCFAFFDIKDDGSRNVLRFNSLGFKDNYRQGNLLNMNLRLYAVNVGNTWIAELAAGKELSLEGFHLPPIRIMSRALRMQKARLAMTKALACMT